MRNSGFDIIKGIIIIVLVFLAGVVSAYTPEQQTTLDGMNLGFQLGIAHEKASHGQNITEFNALVDTYNAWIRQHFGADVNLFMPKITDTTPLASTETNDTTPLASTETNDTTPLASAETNDSTPLAVSPERIAATPSEVSAERKAPVYVFEGELSQFGKKQITDMA
jgi:hypothetical protein